MRFVPKPIPMEYGQAVRVLYDIQRKIATTLDALIAGRSVPAAAADPIENGHMVIEATNNTTITIKLKGSDGVVRSGTVTLS